LKLEIEAKVKVDSLEQTAYRLKEAGACFKQELVEKDCFFADADRQIVKPGCGLRLRRQKTSENEKFIVTYKGPKQKGRFKSRHEIEFEVSDAATVEQFLAALGCYKKLIFEKQRSVWQLENCLVCLDKLPMLGCFVEVEGPDEAAIAEVLKRIGLSEHEHINKGYAKLMRSKLDEIGSGKMEVLLDGRIG
jgi:predicted adenylyl cyclase CyaB